MLKPAALPAAVLLALLAGCAAPPQAGQAPSDLPFVVQLDAKARWPSPEGGYDPQLPGYHVVGQIASATFIPQADARRIKKLVIAIDTDPARKPHLDFVELDAPDFIVNSSMTPGVEEEIRDPHSRTPFKIIGHAPQGTHLKLTVVGNEVQVELSPETLEHARKGFTLSWIDWYR